MNFHPLFVHFPIALLSFYAICELIRFQKVTERPFWFYLKASFVTAGIVTAEFAAGTGELVQNMFADTPEKHAIVPVHALWAEMTIGVFFILAVSYVTLWVHFDATDFFLKKNPRIEKLWGFLTPIARRIIGTPLAPALAVFGLIGVTITGSLGGAMVHGPEIDPIVSSVYHLFF